MVQTTVDLDVDLSNFVEIYKAQNQLKNKNEAIGRIIQEYKVLKDEFAEKMLAIECAISSEKALEEAWLSKEDDDAFDYLQ